MPKDAHKNASDVGRIRRNAFRSLFCWPEECEVGLKLNRTRVVVKCRGRPQIRKRPVEAVLRYVPDDAMHFALLGAGCVPAYFLKRTST